MSILCLGTECCVVLGFLGFFFGKIYIVPNLLF